MEDPLFNWPIFEWIATAFVMFVVFVWAPWSCFWTGRIIGGLLSAPCRELKEWYKDQKKEKRPKGPPPLPREKRPKHLYTVDDACEVLNVPLETIKKYILERKIHTFEDNGEVYLAKGHVDALIPKPAKPSKRSKRDYPVVTSFNEEHRITNPVEFGT